MPKQAPTFGRLAAMAIFALSCFGLLLFLWLAFGGAIPLKPKGYRFPTSFAEATQLAREADVRISGVPVGKVKDIQPDKKTGRSHVVIELDSKYAPLPERRAGDPAPEDAARRDLRRAHAGHAEREADPGGRHAGRRRRSRRPSSSTRSSARSTSAPARLPGLDAVQAQAIDGRGHDLNDAFGNLGPFADDAASWSTSSTGSRAPCSA